ncbi:MAG TPA: hypothetical protein VEY12_01270 [Thermoplasmata archaeon]|nr:hypothetical protein [Thermoplasmata archaeon]
MLGKKIVVIGFRGDSEFDDEHLEGTAVRETKSKTWEGSAAFVVRMDPSSQEKLKRHTGDPTELLVDLDGVPRDAFPGMPGYKGGAFVRLWGRGSRADVGFSRYLGRGEALESRGQEPGSMPPHGLRTEAETVVRLARKDFGIRLDLTLRGLLKGATVVARAKVPEEGGDFDVDRRRFLWGAFFGECLRSAYGGEWQSTGGRIRVLIPRREGIPVQVIPSPLFDRVKAAGNASPARELVKRLRAARRSRERDLPPIQ